MRPGLGLPTNGDQSSHSCSSLLAAVSVSCVGSCRRCEFGSGYTTTAPCGNGRIAWPCRAVSALHTVSLGDSRTPRGRREESGPAVVVRDRLGSARPLHAVPFLPATERLHTSASASNTPRGLSDKSAKLATLIRSSQQREGGREADGRFLLFDCRVLRELWFLGCVCRLRVLCLVVG